LRLGNLVRKEAVQFWRYKTLLLFAILLPVIQLRGVARSTTKTLELPMVVYDQDHSASSRRLAEMLDASDLFTWVGSVPSRAEVERRLEAGTAEAGLTIPAAFERDLLRGRPVTVQLTVDASEPAAASQVNAYLERAAPLYAQRLVGQKPAGLAIAVHPAVETRSRVWFNEEMREETFRLPGAMASGVAMLAIFLTAAVIVRERETGTLEQLFVTPVQPLELIVSKSLLALLITYVAFLEMLSLCVFRFGIPLRGSLPLLMALTGFYIFVEMGLGLLISVVAQTQGQALLAAFFWSLLERILSGQILPVENMPPIAQAVAQLVPLTHFTAIVRGIMLRGVGLTDVRVQLLALAGLGGAIYALAATRLQKRLD
jgi:ABC-2 type transport system permease protein